MTNQVSPLGTQDFSQYLTNIANSGADVIINVNWGRDAVLSVQQAKQFGLTPKMKMVIPYQIPFLAKEAGPELIEGVYAATDFWWTLRGQVSTRQDVRRGVREEVRLQAGVGRQQRLYVASRSGRGWCRRPARSIRRMSSRQYEKGEKFDSTVGEVYFRKEDHQLVRPVDHRQGQGAEGHEEQGGLLGGISKICRARR